MIYRFMFHGFFETCALTVKQDAPADYVSASFFGKHVFLYVESHQSELNPNDIVDQGILPLPDGSLWTRMPVLFHYSTPLSDEHWAREHVVPDVKINFVKPEMVSSYAYYHYQFQEEYPGDGEKYGIIFALSNLLIMYLEPPHEKETCTIPGKLSSKNTPKATWQSLMNSHFVPWDDFDGTWRNTESKILLA